MYKSNLAPPVPPGGRRYPPGTGYAPSRQHLAKVEHTVEQAERRASRIGNPRARCNLDRLLARHIFFTRIPAPRGAFSNPTMRLN